MRRSNTVLQEENKPSAFGRSEIQSRSKTRQIKRESSRSKESNHGINNYKFIQLIGKGTFGKVYSALEIKTQRRVAIKVVELYGNYKNRQLDIIRRIKHPNCIQLQTHFTGYEHEARKNKNYEFTLYLVMQELDFSMTKYVQIRKKRSPITLSQIELKIISFQLVKALDYLNVQGLQLRVKICDYGSAKIIESGEENLAYICSRFYRAPQLLFGYTKYSTAVDTWSLGCVLLELLIGEPVFPGDSTIDQIIQIIKILGSPPKSFFDQIIKIDIQHFNFPTIQSLKFQRVFGKYKVPSTFFDLVRKCLSFDWRKRIKPFQAFLQPLFQDLSDSKYYDHTRKLPLLFDFEANLAKCTSQQRQTILIRFGADIAEQQNNKENRQNISTKSSFQ